MAARQPRAISMTDQLPNGKSFSWQVVAGSPLTSLPAPRPAVAAAQGSSGGPSTPETSTNGSSMRPWSAQSGHSSSATPSTDDALSLASGTSASLDAATDAPLFAPATTEDAVHAVPSLLSQLLSGRTDEQVLAARKLLAYCRRCGRPVEAAVAAAGGVHMLLIMLDSLDRTLRDVCTRILTDLAADDCIRAEILAGPGGTAKVIQLMYRGILDGQASAGRFLEILADTRDENIRAALCHGKVLRMLCRTVESAPSPRATGAALSALQAFCRQDAANLRKLVWGGGAEALLGVLRSEDSTPEQAAAALSLLECAVAAVPDTAASLSTPTAVTVLAAFVGDPARPLAQQAAAAAVLAKVARGPMVRPGLQHALTNHVLPRVFEVLRDVAVMDGVSPRVAAAAQGMVPNKEATAAAARLRAAAAVTTAALAARDAECCHSLLFYSQLLRPTVAVLVEARRYAAAQQLLQATHRYAVDGAGASSGSCFGCAGQ